MDVHTDALALALKHREAGALPLAEAECLQIVRADPSHAGAWNLLGVLAFQSGKATTALEYFDRATRTGPTVANFHGNRGAVLQGLGRHSEAEAEFREALRLDPASADAHYNLGTFLHDVHRLEESEAAFRRALELQPADARIHNNLGTTLRALGRADDAAACFRRALALRPDYPDAHTNLGTVLWSQGQFEEAAASHRRCLASRPNHAEAHFNLGIALLDLGRLTEAEASYRRAVALQPNYAQAHNNLGSSLVRQGRLAEAEPCIRRALELTPDDPRAHSNLAHLLLAQGDFERGWAEYEWRWRLPDSGLTSHPKPLWDGSPLNGRTILLRAEQGLGDTLQFVRYAGLVKERGGTVLCQCPSRLLALLQNCAGIDELITAGAAAAPIDVQAPLLSLPRLLGTTVPTIPATVPYLAAGPSLRNRWRDRLQPVPGFKVGIAWQGSPLHGRDRERSVPLALFEPLARIPGVELFSLQVGPGQDQVAALGGRFPLTDLGSDFDPASMSDAAAAMANLDLVVTVDSALAHLAGALGARVWVVLSFTPDWRWLLNRDDCPWYPTMRLFRQGRPGDWASVFGRLMRELAASVV